MNYQAAYIRSAEQLSRREMARQRAIQPLWPRYSPSQGPWRADAASMEKLPPYTTPPTTAPFRPQVAEITRMGQVGERRSPLSILLGLSLALGVGYLVGKGKGKAQRSSGKRYDFGVPQAAAVLLLGPLGAGYQVGRYQSHKR